MSSVLDVTVLGCTHTHTRVLDARDCELSESQSSGISLAANQEADVLTLVC